MRTIIGKELDKAILKLQGRTWDGMPIPKLKVEDLRTNQSCNAGILQRFGKWVTGAYVKIGYFAQSDADFATGDDPQSFEVTYEDENIWLTQR